MSFPPDSKRSLQSYSRQRGGGRVASDVTMPYVP